MAAIKVLVVDDSAFMRKVISEILGSIPGIEVVGKAQNGSDALNKIQRLKPDVVTLDIEMPVMDGLTTLAKIMDTNPLPVIMLSSLTKKGAEQTLQALELGAVDFIAKPSGQISLDIEKVKDDIINKVIIAAEAGKGQVISRRLAKKSYPITGESVVKAVDSPAKLNKLVVIGTSTGGPKALHQVISSLPRNIDAGVLIVQHMPPGFTRSLAERLNLNSELTVKEAEHGDKILPGWAYVAPGDYHLKVESRAKQEEKGLFIQLDKSEACNGHRPSVEVMFKSVAENFGAHIVAVIMTGMGNDGAAAMKSIKERNGKTIAEDQSSCVVYGMPKAAVESGYVDKVVPLNEISRTIVNML